MLDNHHKNLATFIHLSTFSRFIIPFGNFIGPIILWAANKEKSEFIDQHGKQAINFQISVLLYAIIIGTISVPFFIFKLFNTYSNPTMINPQQKFLSLPHEISHHRSNRSCWIYSFKSY